LQKLYFSFYLFRTSQQAEWGKDKIVTRIIYWN